MTQEQYYWYRRQQLLRAYAMQQRAAGASSVGRQLEEICPFTYKSAYDAADSTTWNEMNEILKRQPEYYDPAGGCSGVISPNHRYHGRNLDWFYDNYVAVLAKINGNPASKKFASIGICLTKVTPEDIAANIQNDAMKLIPFRIDDGINEKGLTIQINVTPYKPNAWKHATDKTWPDKFVVRHVLDECSTAEQAANEICKHGYYTCSDHCYHWMISDATSTWLVEDGEAVNITDRPYITNFRIAEDVLDFDKKIDWDKLIESDPHGMGLERYQTIVDDSSELDDTDKLMDLMSRKLRYINAYDFDRYGLSSAWVTEACQEYALSDYGFTREYMISQGIDMDKYDPLSSGVIDYDLSAAKNDEAFRNFIYGATCQKADAKRDYPVDYQRWQTTWSVIYDRQNFSLSAVFQENDQIIVASLK